MGGYRILSEDAMQADDFANKLLIVRQAFRFGVSA